MRPAYGSETLLVEFFGDHRSKNYPNVQSILAHGLNARSAEHPALDTAAIGIATDEYISLWHYEHGAYEVDDDIWGLFILAPENNAKIMSDIARVLLASEAFEEREADVANYR